MHLMKSAEVEGGGKGVGVGEGEVGGGEAQYPRLMSSLVWHSRSLDYKRELNFPFPQFAPEHDVTCSDRGQIRCSSCLCNGLINKS